MEKSVREVVDGAKQDGRETERHADHQRFPCAMDGKQEDCEYRKQQHRKDAAEDDRSTPVVMHGSLRMSVK